MGDGAGEEVTNVGVGVDDIVAVPEAMGSSFLSVVVEQPTSSRLAAIPMVVSLMVFMISLVKVVTIKGTVL